MLQKLKDLLSGEQPSAKWRNGLADNSRHETLARAALAAYLDHHIHGDGPDVVIVEEPWDYEIRHLVLGLPLREGEPYFMDRDCGDYGDYGVAKHTFAGNSDSLFLTMRRDFMTISKEGLVQYSDKDIARLVESDAEQIYRLRRFVQSKVRA